MANRYWVGGTGTWDTTSTTNWSASSGGASGASVPTAADSVFFDQASTYTVTMTGALTCLDLTVSAGTVTFATGTSPTLAVSGSFSIAAATVWSSTAAITFNATTTGKTITTNSVTMSGPITLDGVGGGWTLGSALVMNTGSYANGLFTVTRGTFNTGNFNMTLSVFSSSNSNTRSITLGTSTIAVARWTLTTTTNLTFSGASSTITKTILVSGDAFDGGGLTYGTLNMSGYTNSLTGTNTFTTVNLTAGATSIAANQTIGTFNSTGHTLQSSTYGTQRTLAVTTSGTLTDAWFRDIAVTGATLSGTRIGNLTNNSGITFTTPKTVYWNKAAGGNWFDTNAWALTSGGATSSTNNPLPQDTAIIENTGLNVGATITLNLNPNICSLNCSTRTNAMTLAQPGLYQVYGDFIMGSGVTLSGLATNVSFLGTNNQSITMNGVTFTRQMNVDKPVSGTVTLTDTFVSALGLNLYGGTFTANADVTFTTVVYSFNTVTRAINMGTGTWTLTGTGSVWNGALSTNFTLNKGTANIVLSDTSTSARTFDGGGLTYNKLTIGGATGTSTLTITGSNTFTELASTKTVAHTILFTGGTTQTFTSGFTVSGTAGNVVTIGSTNTTAVNLRKPSAWYVGANSTDGGNNTGLLFAAGGGIDYLSISRINGFATYAGGNNLLFGSNF